jgi:hypothetical protein
MMSFSFSGGVEVYGFISPTDITDQYPVIDPLYGIDGFRNVNTLSDLNSIPNLRRRAGMVVGVSGGTTYYKLNPSPWNGTIGDWSLFQTGGGSGTFTGGTVTGDTIFTQGVTATTLNVNGINITGDTYVTGGTYYTGGTIVFDYNTIGNFPVSGLTEDLNNAIAGLAEADELTIELDISTNKIRLKDIVAPGSGGTRTFQGDTIFTSGLTANTLNVNGVNITGDTYVTGGTYYTGGTIIFDYNTGGDFPVTGLTEDLNNAIAGLAETDELTIELDVLTNKIRLKDIVAAGSGDTRTFQGDIVVDGLLNINTIGSGVPIINLGLDNTNQVVTGITDQIVTITGGTNIEINGSYPNFGIDYTGQTTFDYLPLSGGTVTGNTLFTQDLNVNVISATTYQNLPQYYAGITSGATNWVDNGDGTITLPTTQVALFKNPDFEGPLNLYNVVGGVYGLANNDTNYIAVNYSGGFPNYVILNNDTTINDSDIVLYLIVYRANNFIHVLEFGNYGSGLPNKINDRILSTDRFAHESGCQLSLSGSTGIVEISSGVVWNGVYQQQLMAINSYDDIFFQNYHIGGNWVYDTTATTINNTYYDDGTNLVSANTGTYLVNWYFRGQEYEDHIYEVFGTSGYTNVAEAELSVEPILPELVTSHAFLVGRIIIGVGQTTGLTQSAFVTVFQSTQVTFHNDLLGLQGGAPNEYLHLSSNEYSNLAFVDVNNNFTTNQTINGDLIVTGNTTVNSLSATTLNVNGINITGDTYVTGGTYYTGGTIVFDYNTGGDFPVSGLTEDLNIAIAGLAETDELTIELDVSTNKIRLKDVVAPGSGNTRTFQGDIVIESGLTATTAFIIYTQWTLDFMDSLDLEIYAPNDISIDSIIDLVNNPTTTILVNNLPYTPTTLITSGDKINVTTDINSVIQFNITNYL